MPRIGNEHSWTQFPGLRLGWGEIFAEIPFLRKSAILHDPPGSFGFGVTKPSWRKLTLEEDVYSDLGQLFRIKNPLDNNCHS